jgi:uncharacterized delta-60 repeat protein
MKHYYWLLVLLVGRALAGWAQTLDPTFQPTTLFNQSSAVRVLALAAQADGKTLVAGDFQALSGTLSNNVLRLHADLTRDLTFRPGQGANAPVQALAVQADGKVLIGGSFAAYASTPTGPVARLLPSGELDPSFQLDPALVGGQVATLAVQASGRILVGGPASASLPGGLVRLLPSGTLDPTFSSGVGAGSDGQVLALAGQLADGKVLVAGAFTSFNGRASQSLVRLLPNGAPDGSFASPSFNAGTVLYTVALHPSGDILVGGYWQSSVATQTAVLKRLQPSGVPDPLFNAAFSSFGRVRCVQVDASGRVLVAGFFTTYNNTGSIGYTHDRHSVVRLLATGEPDPTFPPTGSVSYDDAPEYYAQLPLTSGQLLLGGQVPLGPAGLSLLSAAGVPDPGLNLGLQWRGISSRAVPLLSGQLLVSGTYTSLNGQAVTQQLQRLNADGSFDQDRKLPPPMPINALSASYSTLFPQADGQVYAFVTAKYCQQGNCADYPPNYQYFLYRIGATNTVDATFTPVLLGQLNFSTAVINVRCVVRYSNGDILVGTQPVNALAADAPRLRRYQASGGAVAGFTAPAFPAGSRLDQVLVQADDRVVVSYYLSSGESRLVRLLADGSLDPSFTLGISPALPAGATFSATLLQPDGKLLVSGSFTSFAGVATPTSTVRLNPDGTVDASFQPTASLAPLVPLAALPDGRLLVRANNQPGTASLRRLLPSGSLDASFAPVLVTAAAYPVTSWSVVLQPTDQKPVLYGDFDAVGGQPRTGLARLNAATALATRPGSGASQVLTVYPNPAQGSATLLLTTVLEQAGTVQLYDNLGREVRRQLAPAHAQQVTLPLAGLRSGLYWLRCGAATVRLVVE